MPGVGPLEIAIVLIIVLIIFGPKRLPGLGKSLGTGMREFKDSITGDSKHGDDDDDERPAQLSDAPAPREASTPRDADQSVAANDERAANDEHAGDDERAAAKSGSTRTDEAS